MATGHDAEFQRLFAEEAVTRLDRLGRELLQLEQEQTPKLVDSLFRDAHTLKGSAGMVGLPSVSAIAHAMEDLLDDLRAGRREADTALIDGLLTAVDGLGRLIPDLVAGHERSSEAAIVEAGVRSIGEGAAAAAAVVAPTAPAPSPAAPPAPAATERESVRVAVDRLDELVRLVGEAATANLRLSHVVSARLGTTEELQEARVLRQLLGQLQEKALRARMVPVSTITDRLQRAVRDVARSRGREVRWEVLGVETELDRHVLDQVADPLLHLVRNAVDHGIEPPEVRLREGKPAVAVVRLHAMQIGSEVVIAVSDDGRGIDIDRVRTSAAASGVDVGELDDDQVLDLIFRTGLSTADQVSDISGRGVGLDVVRSDLEVVRGRVEVRTTPGRGSEFRIRVPITLVVLPCLIVEAAAQRFALPLHDVVVATAPRSGDGRWAAGTDHVRLPGGTVPVHALADVLGIGSGAEGPTVVVRDAARRHAFTADALVGQRDVVVASLGRTLPRLGAFAGASVEADGSVLLVLDAAGLIDLAGAARSSVRPAEAAAAPSAAAARILVVDDALTVRELQRSILERAGHDVRVAGDGAEALARLAEGAVDLVLTDLEMPRMDGLELTAAIRSQPALAGLPVVILTSRASEDDRRRGLEAGADAYVVKSSFDQVGLLALVDRLLGTR